MRLMTRVPGMRDASRVRRDEVLYHVGKYVGGPRCARASMYSVLGETHKQYESGLVVLNMCRPCPAPLYLDAPVFLRTRRLQHLARIAARYIAHLVLLPAIWPSRVGGLAGADEGMDS
jgi:hypothetical protein